MEKRWWILNISLASIMTFIFLVFIINNLTSFIIIYLPLFVILWLIQTELIARDSKSRGMYAPFWTEFSLLQYAGPFITGIFYFIMSRKYKLKSEKLKTS